MESLRGGKSYLRLQINKFLTEILDLFKRIASLEATVGMKER